MHRSTSLVAVALIALAGGCEREDTNTTTTPNNANRPTGGTTGAGTGTTPGSTTPGSTTPGTTNPNRPNQPGTGAPGSPTMPPSQPSGQPNTTPRDPAGTAPAPGARTDQALTEQIRTTLRDDTALAALAQRVNVSVSSGVVLLEGSVPTQADRELIERRITDIPGVNRVDNQLTVTPANPPQTP